MEKIPVFLASDENYAPFCATTILSILDHTESFVDFYILDSGIKKITKNNIIKSLQKDFRNFSIEFIKIDLKLFKNFPVRHHFSLDMFSRYLIPQLKPQLKKVIYSDVDVIFTDDIKKLYDEKLGKYPVGAVPDFKDMPENKKAFGISPSHHYFCSGLLLIDCDYWQRNNVIDQLFDKTIRYKDSLIFPDLDVLNIVFANNYKKLDYRYCVMVHVADEMRRFNKETKRALKKPFIIHYSSGDKPWNNIDVEFFNIFWSYVKRTPFFETLFDKIILKTKQELSTFKTATISLKKEADIANSEADFTKKKLKSTEAKLDLAKKKCSSTKAELILTRTELDSTKTNLNVTRVELGSTKAELSAVYSSREWRAGLAIQRITGSLIPKESRRRRAAVGSWRTAKKILRLARKTENRLLSLRSYLENFKPRKKRKINLKSKKLVYVGHSYHAKTKSTVFLIDYLKQFYDVTVILDESWQGKPSPDLSFVDESYLGIVFFQIPPSKEALENIRNDNLIYFPMYDGVPHDFEFWDKYRNLKVINFSRTLHKKLIEWGLNSMYLQYFPEPPKFLSGNKNEVFFWQRLTRININTITPFFKKKKLKIHIHKAIDPGQEFIQPAKKDEKEFHITYSDWFETREEMWDLIKRKGIYIAPREFEGIGMSFLEAMAMGKAVIAVDNPTMNEYIKHGKTGYLFDFSNPKEIDLSNLEQVQKNTYRFMSEGYKKWEKDKPKIIDFIKKR